MVRGPVRKQSMDPVRSGGPRTRGQSFRVTQHNVYSSFLKRESPNTLNTMYVPHSKNVGESTCRRIIL